MNKIPENPENANDIDDSQFRRLLEAIDDQAIYMLDKNGIILSWNKGAVQIKGYTKDEVIGKHFSLFFPPEAIEENIPERELEFARSHGSHVDEGWRFRKNGDKFWANIAITALFDHYGNLQGYTKITKDLSERKRLEERFRRVVESAPNAMVMINQAGRIEMVNAQAERLFEYPRSEMLGNLVEMLVPERFRAAHPGKRALFFGEPQSRPMGAGRDLYGRRKNGSEFPVEIGLNPLETEDGLMVLSSIVDISDRRQKEEKIQAALKEKDLLLGEIHHRVKNNLQVIHSLLNLQSSVISDPAVKTMLMDSQNRIQSMALIHQTLYQSNDFARVDFAGFLDILIPTLLTSYGQTSQTIDLKVNALHVNLPINSAIPCGLLINELITNSLKHAFPEQRKGAIEVDLRRLDNGMVLLVIADNGIGIPDSLDFNGGATLGLRLVTLLAQQLDGTLTINRHNPTRFSLEFPGTAQ